MRSDYFLLGDEEFLTIFFVNSCCIWWTGCRSSSIVRWCGRI